VGALGKAHITKLAADFVSRVDMRENIFGKFPVCYLQMTTELAVAVQCVVFLAIKGQ